MLSTRINQPRSTTITSQLTFQATGTKSSSTKILPTNLLDFYASWAESCLRFKLLACTQGNFWHPIPSPKSSRTIGKSHQRQVATKKLAANAKSNQSQQKLLHWRQIALQVNRKTKHPEQLASKEIFTHGSDSSIRNPKLAHVT